MVYSAIMPLMKLFFGGFLEEDEKIKKVFRRPIYFALRPTVFWGGIWFGITFLLWFFYPTYDLEEVRIFDLNLIWQTTALIGICYTLAPLISWYVNAIVMTNESVVIVEWPHLFERRSTRIDLHNLDEITTERVGWQSFFLNYGNMIFNKVNGGESIEVKGISAPGRVARRIETYREWALDKKNFTEESALKGVLSHVVRRHVSEAGQPRRERRHGRYETVEDKETVVYKDEIETPREQVIVKKRRTSKPVKQSDETVEIEKRLDDTGGIDIEL